MYHEDILLRLRGGRVVDAEDIEWLRVMRFYEEKEGVVSQAAHDFCFRCWHIVSCLHLASKLLRRV